MCWLQRMRWLCVLASCATLLFDVACKSAFVLKLPHTGSPKALCMYAGMFIGLIITARVLVFLAARVPRAFRSSLYLAYVQSGLQDLTRM